MIRGVVPIACLAVFVVILHGQPTSSIPTKAGRRGGADLWVGRHPEAEEVAEILRRLRKRLEKEGREAREQVLCFVQMSRMWKYAIW